jgi:acyl-CoA thioesterase FadM
MNLIVRSLKVFILSFLKPRLGLFDSSVLSFQVWPTDLDINLHMNNARYLSFMDLGRTDLLLRAGMLRTAFNERWRPVVGNIDIKFRRSLLPFRRFKLTTRLLGWDDKWFYLEQQFVSANEVYAVAKVRGLLIGRNGSVPSQIVLDRMGYQGESL